MSKNYGFSLLELLITIAIFSCLSTIFFTLAYTVRERALIINCRSNMRQVGIAFQQYAYRYNGLLPHSDRDSDTGKNYCWFDRLDPFLMTPNLSTVKQCPKWQGYTSKGETADRHSIKMNGGLCIKERLPETLENRQKKQWYWPRLWDISKKNQTVLLLDGALVFPIDRHTGTRRNNPFYDIENRHLGGANILFVDGSSRFKNATQEHLTTGKTGWKNGGGYIWKPFGGR